MFGDEKVNYQLVVVHIADVIGLECQQAYPLLASVPIHALPVETCLAFANRYLKLAFPVQRNAELTQQLIQKTVYKSAEARQIVLQLPMADQEQLVNAIFKESIHMVGGILEEQSLLNEWLTVIAALEETYQFDLANLVSEDLAVLEQAHGDRVESNMYQFTDERDTLSLALVYEQYRAMPSINPPFLAYWLSRQATLCKPWAALLALYQQTPTAKYPRLDRLCLMRDWLLPQLTQLGSFWQNPAVHIEWLESTLPSLWPSWSTTANVASPIRCLVLVEGQTERVVLPAVAQAMGINLVAHGVWLREVGGKSQLLNDYVDWSGVLRVPIVVIMDADARAISEDLRYYQRPGDAIMLLEEGEIEDRYPIEWVVAVINEQLGTDPPLTVNDIPTDVPRSRWLQQLWRAGHWGSFDKVAFAHWMADWVVSHQQTAPTMDHLIHQLLEVAVS